MAPAASACRDKYVESMGDVVTTDCGEKPGGFLALEAEMKAKAGAH